MRLSKAKERERDEKEREQAALEAMAEDGVVTLSGGALEMTTLGEPLIRAVARVFDGRSGAASRFSRVL